ncbi:sensor histidine kinase [Acidaminobacter sp. JC074]|uniref:cache domain-containing sensor histidine kinase n=1 Tax=Acidaminobacter sp. JC074 TaxID=2530199 RepID=UPI001F0CF34D|nr:sensor histidine kinase [Acidaminobacter sp. JC074]
MSFRKKLLMALIGISIVPIILISIAFRFESKRDIQNKYLILFDRTLKETANHMSVQFSTIEKALDEVMVHDDVQENLHVFDENDTYSRYTTSTAIKMTIYKDPVMNNYINIFEILTNDDVYFYNYGFDEIDEDTRKSIKSKTYDLAGKSYYDPTSREGEILISRVINWRFSLQPMGYMIMSVPESYFSNVLDGLDSINDGILVYVINKDGVILSSNKTEKIGSIFDNEKAIAGVIEDKQVAFSVNEDNRTYYVTSDLIEETEYYLVCLIPNSYLSEETSRLGLLILIFVVIAILAAILVAFILTRAIFKPINQLVDVMKNTKGGNDLTPNIEYQKRDEIGYLISNFNEMLHRIQSLITKLEVEEREKREAELSMLQAQINPHFLFNVLNSLKWTAKMSQSYSVADGLDALSNLLRDTITNKNEYVSLREEIKNIENYIVIQQMRYGDNFYLINNLSEEMNETEIPKLLLQPIVENSIIHGFENIDYDGKITIDGFLEDGILTLRIADNGKGLIDKQVNRMPSKKLTSIGLSNVEERIKLHFGQEYGLELLFEDGFTVVTLCLPYKKREDHV